MPNQIKSLLNIPNLLSISRVLLIPVFILLLLKDKPTSAFIIFLIAASTDFLDGVAARLLNQKTKLGAVLDPAGDKILMTAAFIILAVPHIGTPNSLPVWLTMAVIGRDLYIVTGALVLYRLNMRRSFPPTLLGKICTICQMSVLLLVLLMNAWQRPASWLIWFYILTLILVFLSGIQYTFIGIRWTREFSQVQD